jgi:superfamily II DNA or RNA helicase
MVWREAGPEGERARLAMIVLRKRALSSAAAAAVSLRRRLDLLKRQSAAERQLPLFPDEEMLEDAEPDEALGAPGLADEAHEHRWLRSLISAAAAVRQESKLRFLTRLLRRISGEPAIVFTEYRDTLQRLAPAIGAGLVLHGGMTSGERVAVVRAFNTRGGRLVATDAAAEGLNLQARCRLAISYELPWNPARLEQRIGRVDRIGQRRTVHAVTLVARDTAEDLILASVARRLTRIAARFGAGDRLATVLSEARTAQVVIGGHPAAPEPEPPPPDAALVEAPGEHLRRAAVEEARALAGRVRSTVTPHRASMHEATVVSSASESTSLPAGIIFVVEWNARTKDGDTIRRELLNVHVPARVARPRDSETARIAARQALDRYGDAIAAAIADRIAALAAETRVSHQRTLESCATRERGLATVDRPDVSQPGLFDRRTSIQADDWRDATARLHDERLLRLERLQASREVVDGWRVAGILIAGTRA